MSLFNVKITKGELDFGSDFNLARWNDFKKQNEGRWVKIDKPKLVRSLSQNAFYWVYLGIVSHDTGNDADDLHEYFKSKLMPKKIVKIHGKKGDYDIERVKSTTELSKLEFGEYMDKISAITEVPIPDSKEWLIANGYTPN